MNRNYNAFISYGRADSKDFATKLYEKLTKNGLKIWFDQNDIPLGVDFQNQIDDGITKADNFLFIIAPHAVNSPYCLKEIELAVKYNKQIIPLLHVEQITYEIWQQRNPQKTLEDWEIYQQKGLHSSFPNMHSEIGKINWIYFRENVDNFETSFAGLIEFLYRHEDDVKKHTELLVKALEWKLNQKQNFYLLVGQELIQAEKWLKIKFNQEQPPCIPTDLHCEFICESIKNSHNLMTQVFLGYAEADQEIMEKVTKSLMRSGITIWKNKTDIQTGTDFQTEINRGIEGANNIVYLLSQKSLYSEYCQLEINHALSLNKRIIPLLIEAIDLAEIPIQIRGLQFIDLTGDLEKSEYHESIDKLLKELLQDAIYYEQHKVLLVKALKWQEQNHNPSILLRGYNLEHYQSWLEIATSKNLHPPTPLQIEFIAESAKQPPKTAIDVFISYSRADSNFVRKLNEALELQGKFTWFDQESISSGTDFQQEIYRGIEQSDNFLFVISPNSVNSPYCADEVEYAKSLNKRFVTILYRQVETEQLHPELLKVQWIDFRKHGGYFHANFSELIRTLDTDREYLREHTKKSYQAREWKQKGKCVDLLLRGSESAISYEWLQTVKQQQKQPPVTELLAEFIHQSQAEAERLEKVEIERKKRELEKDKKAFVATRTRNVILSISLIITTGLSIFAWREQRLAQQESKIASGRQLAAQSKLIQNQHGSLYQRSLLLAVESIKKFQQLDLPSVEADQALRLGLSLLPRFILGMKHQGVETVTYSSDGKYIASGGWDNTARLWDARTGKEIFRFPHDDAVNAVVFSSDSKYIATASSDKTARLWDLTTGQEIFRFPHQDRVNAVVFSSDSKYIATASSDKTARLWDLTTGQEIFRFSNDDEVEAIAYSPDSKYIVTANSKTARIWNTRNGKETNTLNLNHTIRAIAVSPDSKYIAIGSFDNIVKVWNINNGKEVTSVKHDNIVSAVVFSSDSKYIATGSGDKTARVWDISTGTELARINPNGEVSAIAFSPDGKYLVTANSESTLGIWDVSNDGKLFHVSLDHQISDVAYSPDGKYIATANDGSTQIWDAVLGEEILQLKHNKPVTSVEFSPDGKYIATASSNKITIWDSTTGKQVTQLQDRDSLFVIQFSRDRKYIATGSRDRMARVWDIATSKEVASFSHDGLVDDVSFSPDNKYLATASWDRNARIWDIATGKEIIRLNHELEVVTIAFGGNKYIATGSFASNDAQIWDIKTGEEITRLHHDGMVQDIVFSQNGKYIATASSDNTARVWDATTNQEIARFKQDKSVLAVAFSPDHKYVVTAADNIAQSHFLKQEDLVQEICSRSSRNLTADEWVWHRNSSLSEYQKTCENLPIHPSVMTTAQEWAINGKGKAAERLLRKLMKLEPDIDLNPETEVIDNSPTDVVRRFEALGKIKKGVMWAKQGKIEAAMAAFRQAQNRQPDIDLNPETDDIVETDPEAVARALAYKNK